MKTKNEDWTLILIICLLAVAILSSCSKELPEPKEPVLYSRYLDLKGNISPWTIEVEGQGSFLKDTTIFIDELTGYVEMKYTTEILSTEIGDPDL